jgi:hypothetical protein
LDLFIRIFAQRWLDSRTVVHLHSPLGSFESFAKLNLCGMRACIAHLFCDESPATVQHSEVEHLQANLIHRGSKQVDSFPFVQVGFDVAVDRAGKPLKSSVIEVHDSLTLAAAPNRFPCNGMKQIRIDALDPVLIVHGSGCCFNGGLKNVSRFLIVAKISDYNESSTVPDPVCGLDKPLVNLDPEAVPFSDPKSRPLSHGKPPVPGSNNPPLLRGFDE